MTIHPLHVVIALTVLAVPVIAEDAKPAPKAVRAKAVVIKKAAAAAAEKPVLDEAEKAAAEGGEKVAIEAKKARAEKAAANIAEEVKAAVKAAEAKPEAKPAAKVAPANLKGFGKNEAARKPAPAAPAAAAAEVRMLGAVPAQINEEQMKQIKEQYKQQLQPVLISELAFIRLTCDIPKEKRPAVLKAGQAIVEDAAQKLADQQNRNRGGGVRVAVQASTNIVNDPPKAIRAALDAALKDVLSEDQLKVYREEAAFRKEQIKGAAIHSVVARLDGMLCLTAEVRRKIAATISDNWQESYERWLQIHQYGDQYFPSVPDQLVSVHLNAEQRQIWTGLQKIGIGGWGNNGGIGVQADDGWWGEAIGPGGANGAIFLDVDAVGF